MVTPEEAQMVNTFTRELFVLLAGLVAVFVPLWWTTRKTQKAVDNQLTNHHDTNLRDDVTNVLTRLESIEKRQRRMHKNDQATNAELQSTKETLQQTNLTLQQHIDEMVPIVKEAIPLMAWADTQMQTGKD